MSSIGVGSGVGVSFSLNVAGIIISITSNVDFAPFTIVDADTWADSAYYTARINPANYTAPDGYALTLAVTREQDDADTGLGFIEVPDTQPIGPEDGLRLTIVATATLAGSPDITRTFVATGVGVNVQPQPTAGTFIVDLLQGQAPLVVPLTDLFEPSVAGREIGPLDVTLTPLPAGVTVGINDITFDPDAIALQANTALSAVAQGTNPTPSTAKALDLSVAVNTISATVTPTIQQGYTGGNLEPLLNVAEMQDRNNWPGIQTDDVIIVFARKDNAGIFYDQINVLEAGSQYQFLASVWQTDGSGNLTTKRLTVQSALMTPIADWLTVTDVNQDGTVWNLTIQDAVSGGPPDSMDLVGGVVIDGRQVPTISVGALRASATDFVRLLDPLAPAYVAGSEPGDTMTLSEPVVASPAGIPVSRQTDVLRGVVVIETDVDDTRLLVADDDGTDISTRTTDTAAGVANSPFASTSPATAVSLAGLVYTPTTFTTNRNAVLTGNMASGLTEFMVSASMERNANTNSLQFFNIDSGSGSYMRAQTNGNLQMVLKDSAGSTIYSATYPGAIDVAMTHIVVHCEIVGGTPAIAVVKNDADISGTAINVSSSSGTGTWQSGVIGLLGARLSTSQSYVGDFQDFMFIAGTSPDPTAIFGADPATFSPNILLGGAGQRALPVGATETPNLNNYQHNGSDGLLSSSIAIVSGNEPFSEVA